VLAQLDLSPRDGQPDLVPKTMTLPGKGCAQIK